MFAYTFTVTWLIAKALDLTMGIRVAGPAETKGLDVSLHAENAYENGEDKTHAPRGHAEQFHDLGAAAPLESEATAATH